MRAATWLLLLFFVSVDDSPRGAFGPFESEQRHQSQIEFYTAVLVGAARAERVCSAYRTDLVTLAAVRYKLGIRRKDRPEIARQSQRVERQVSDRIEKEGLVSWCMWIVDLFGPDGSLIPGLLRHR
jgi:hypothetical protein